jgi:hypothetical protein
LFLMTADATLAEECPHPNVGIGNNRYVQPNAAMYWDDGHQYHFLYAYYEPNLLPATWSDEIHFLDTIQNNPQAAQDEFSQDEPVVSNPNCAPVLPEVVSHGHQGSLGAGLVSLGIGMGSIGGGSGGVGFWRWLFRVRVNAPPNLFDGRFRDYSCGSGHVEQSNYCNATCRPASPFARAGTMCGTSFPVHPGSLTCISNGAQASSDAWSAVRCDN